MHCLLYAVFSAHPAGKDRRRIIPLPVFTRPQLLVVPSAPVLGSVALPHNVIDAIVTEYELLAFQEALELPDGALCRETPLGFAHMPGFIRALWPILAHLPKNTLSVLRVREIRELAIERYCCKILRKAIK
jgi:hypothetical protein